MTARRRWSWLAPLTAIAVCLPCLVLPLLIATGGALVSAIGGVATSSLGIGLLLLAVTLAGAGLVWWRRQAAGAVGCTTPPVDERETEARS